MTTEILRPGYSNISCTENRCVFSGAALGWKFQPQKKDKSVFEKTTNFFQPFCRRERKIIQDISKNLPDSVAHKTFFLDTFT